MAAGRVGSASSSAASARARAGCTLARTGSRRSRRRQLEPESTNSLVESTLKYLRLDDTVRSMRAMRAFDAAVGARIRSRARAERLRGRTLVIRVSSSRAMVHK